MKLTTHGKIFTLRYSPINTIPPVAQRYLQAELHPIRPKILDMYAHRDKNTLWWRVNPGALSRCSRVVRSWTARRTRVAFQVALKQRGFDRDGRRLGNVPLAPGDEKKGFGVMESETGLKGSLEIMTMPYAIEAPFEEVRREMQDQVAALMRKAWRVNINAKEAGKEKKETVERRR